MLTQLRFGLGSLRLASPRLAFVPVTVPGEVRKCHSEPPRQSSSENQTFASLVRNCKLTRIGNPVGKVVVGKIYHTVGDDLYIDFGHKFGCVCTKPRDDRGQYIRGTEVKLKVKSLELSQRFLGYDRDLSLLEAECVLLGLNK